MKISYKQFKKFKEYLAKAARDENNRRYRGKTQMDPDSIVRYHTKNVVKEHSRGERHHLSTLARMYRVFKTIETEEQLIQLLTALRDQGVALGDSWENLLELPRELHDSSNPESIHRIEQELGLDDPERYVPDNATFEDALAAVPLIAKDQQETRRRVQELQFRQQTIGDDIGGYKGFTDTVQEANVFPQAKENRAANNRYRRRMLGMGQRILPKPAQPHAIQQRTQDVQVKRFGNRLMNIPATPFEVVDSITDANPGVRLAKDLVEASNPGLDIKQDFDDSVSEIGGLLDKTRNEVAYIGNRLMSGQLPYTQ